MIITPCNWKEIGQTIELYQIEQTLAQIISEIDCRNLSLSGGIDSSLMCWFMAQKYGKEFRCFTIALNEEHPDYIFACRIARFFNIEWIPYLLGEKRKGISGDEIVKMFYDWILSQHIYDIVACDGIDEFMCGYYKHQSDPTEATYFDFMLRLRDEQLVPLNTNSGKVKVHLPYLDSRIILLLSQIPIYRKVNFNGRKKLMVEMAKRKIPDEIIYRWKYGFCDASIIKEKILS